MKFIVRKIDKYHEVIIDNLGTVMTTAFLNDKESLELVEQLISAAEDLMPDSHSVYKVCLADIREDL